jgi:hypothetical protein
MKGRNEVDRDATCADNADVEVPPDDAHLSGDEPPDAIGQIL